MINEKAVICRNDKGMALVLVLIFTAALMVLGTALISYAINEKLISNYNSLDIRLYYIAEAGAEAGIALLQKDFYYSGDLKDTIGEGSYTVTFKTIDAYSRDLISKGELNGYSKTVSVSMALLEENENTFVVVRQWLNPNANE